MPIDEDNDDGLGGRGRTRREVAAANQWAEALCALHPVELAAAPLPEVIREAVAARAPMSTGAHRNRQTQLIDKLMRALEEEEKEAVRAFLAAPEQAWAGLEAWCDRLLQEGDPALDAWLAERGGDRQRLRNLIRNARRGDPDRRRALRDALAGGPAGP